MPCFHAPAAGVESDVNFDFTIFVPLPRRMRDLGWAERYPGPTSVQKLWARLLDFDMSLLRTGTNYTNNNTNQAWFAHARTSSSETSTVQEELKAKIRFARQSRRASVMSQAIVLAFDCVRA